ncbi:MAG TPA: Cj0069 family protein [Candidatus Paceibacterota bacterium]
MNKKVVVIEVRTGDEKLRDAEGYRKDTMPIVQSLTAKGFSASVSFYTNEEAETLIAELSDAAAVISRVNPGNIPGGEAKYFAFLQALEDKGVVVLASPKVMLSYGAKDAVSKLAGTAIVPTDTVAYYTQEELVESFPKLLAIKPRVLKQNRGSQGSGIWLVKVKEPGAEVTMDTVIEATEAVDNHTEEHPLGEFLSFCNQYLVGENGMLVDMPFLPRIAEGEVRIVLVGKEPIFVVHKKPQEGEFSATLGSGAKYDYQKPDAYPALMEAFNKSIPVMREKLGGLDTPLIWTADFILDTDADGNDTYVLGEMNCSCVGFTSQLDYGIQDKIAEEVAQRIA